MGQQHRAQCASGAGRPTSKAFNAELPQLLQGGPQPRGVSKVYIPTKETTTYYRSVLLPNGLHDGLPAQLILMAFDDVRRGDHHTGGGRGSGPMAQG